MRAISIRLKYRLGQPDSYEAPKLDPCGDCKVAFDSFWGPYIRCLDDVLFTEINDENVITLLTSENETTKELGIAWTLNLIKRRVR